MFLLPAEPSQYSLIGDEDATPEHNKEYERESYLAY